MMSRTADDVTLQPFAQFLHISMTGCTLHRVALEHFMTCNSFMHPCLLHCHASVLLVSDHPCMLFRTELVLGDFVIPSELAHL